MKLRPVRIKMVEWNEALTKKNRELYLKIREQAEVIRHLKKRITEYERQDSTRALTSFNE
jgi:hypothetical protein